MDSFFSRLGLTEKEAQTFLKLLPLGAQPVSVVAKHVGVPRSSMYFIIEKLKQRRLVEDFERAGIKYVKCIPVKEIADVLKAEERNVRQTLSLFEEKLQELQALESTLSVTPKMTVSEGKESVMKVYQSLTHEKEFCAFFNASVFGSLVDMSVNIIPEVLAESGGTAREITIDCPEAREYKQRNQTARHQIKFFTKGNVFLSDCLICKDRVCMITYGENEVAAIEIFAPTVAATHRTLFNELWRSLE